MKTTIEVCDNGITFEEVEPGTIFTIVGKTNNIFVKTEIVEIPNITNNKVKRVFNTVCLNDGTHLFTLVDTKIKAYEKVECR